MASPLVEDENGINSIQLACQTNYAEGLKILFNNYPTLQYSIDNCVKVARLCIQNNSIDAFKIFIEYLPASSTNTIDEEGLGIIHHVVLSDKLDFLKAIVAHNKKMKEKIFDLDLKAIVNKTEKSPIELAKSAQVVELLYANNASVKKASTTLINDVVKRSTQWMVTGKCFSPSELHKAAAENNVNFIKNYTGKFADVVDSFQMTPLIYAINENSLAAISALLDIGANPNFFTGTTTAFHYCALLGNASAFSLLIDHSSPDLSKRDSRGRTVLLCALTNKNPMIIRSIVKPKPDISEDSLEISSLLISHDDSVSEALFDLVYTDEPFTNGQLQNGKSLLWNALNTNHLQLTKAMVRKQKGKKVIEYEPDYEECFHIIIQKGYEDIFKSFIEQEILTGIQNTKYLLFDTLTNKTNAIRVKLLELIPNISNSIDQMGNNFLHHSAIYNQTESIKSSVTDLKIDVNSKNALGETSLHLLMQNSSEKFEENFKFLIENGANIEALNSKNQNILHSSVEHNNLETLQKLIPLLDDAQFKKFLSQKDIDDQTPLELSSKHFEYNCSHFLSKFQQLPIFTSHVTVKEIVQHHEKGYSPNVFDINGTPLISYVIKQKDLKPDEITACVKQLINYKANPSLEDSNNLSPIHHAILTGNIDVVKILVENGANLLIEPIVTIFSKENEQKEIADYLKIPEKRASAIYELLSIQDNAVPILGCISKNEKLFGNDLETQKYMYEVKYMHRLLTLFRQRFQKIFAGLKTSTTIGPFLLYFADAFLPLLEIASSYTVTISNIRASKTLAPVLSQHSGHQKLSFDDAMIVPTQQFTYYPELIKAIISATDSGHPDFPLLQKAHIKFSNIGRTITEKKLITESQKELRSIRLKTTIKDKSTPFILNDVLLCRGQFEKKSYNKPKFAENEGSIISTSASWGLKTYQMQTGSIHITHFRPFGSSMDSFFSNPKIAIILFQKTILFGIQKTSDKFKLKFSCRTSEVLWDFASEYGMESVMLYAPFGSLLLKFSPPKGSSANFERNRWRSDIDKLQTTNEADLESNDGVEFCYVSWVGEETKCVHSHTFVVHCSDKNEAKTKIIESLAKEGIKIMKKSGSDNLLINFDFQTVKVNKGQKLEVISDLFV
ncbi:serine/threonine-protein phosphatase 6 regulatory ankyrin repeat subunit B-like [Histomonas meleagridis]|uniref:serine/threonine-protein phosphatase 6 regulatory ankyrin repeat subunit B-like n=1 Tax=Histomonas meleagridis TaxID=135588 RepID=UPI0035595B02|nr:serine/threonine-protein phosphatase 6 regulatory ankyrin repeat subunit B-like [Histomonas meleagridis]KAH0796842.1 serine/threonine-protein phosphatase 6 regulatory ankyrin repeat subunit B-like [Histomonas meleagridis]